MSSEVLQAGGLTHLKTLDLVYNGGTERLDLKNLTVEIDVYEDIFSNVMTGTVTLVEAFNLIYLVPIIGEEWIDLEFKTPEFPDDKKIKHRFYVYKITSRIVGSDMKSMYVLNLISYDAINDLNQKISKPYNGNFSETVKKVFSGYIEKDSNRYQKPIEVENSSNKLKFVSNFWSPYKIINYCASLAENQKGTPNYIFFESNKKYRFVSLETLLTQEPKYQYFYDSATRRVDSAKEGQSVRDVVRDVQTIRNLYVNHSFDYIKQNMSGMYSTSTLEVDLVRKEIKKHKWVYSTDFDSSKHLSPFKVSTDFVPYDQRNGLLNVSTIYPRTHDGIELKIGKIHNKRLPLLGQMDIFSVDVEAQGRTDIAAGEVVYLELGTYGQAKEILQTKQDKYYTGKYLVGAIMHRVTKTRHEMKMQLLKDSLNDRYEGI